MRTDRTLSVIGVEVTDTTQAGAVRRLLAMARSGGSAQRVYIVNANTLNLAYVDDRYRNLLNRGELVLSDGTGVRWAARVRGVRLQDNLNGTDLIPALLEADTGSDRLRYYLLGSTPDAIERAAGVARTTYPQSDLVGYAPGFFEADEVPAVCSAINAARPHVLLVAMGNPLQERWIDEHLALLDVPVCIGVGALVDRWAGDLVRAPSWVRRIGFEWVDILRKQPHKWKRYLLGNPVFLWRMLRTARADRRLMASRPG